MNVIQILWKLGYDVLSFNDDGEYTIVFNKARKKIYSSKIKKGIIKFDGSLDDKYTVKVGEVSFNGSGDLFVEFLDVNTDEVIDAYEYRNMEEDELF